MRFRKTIVACVTGALLLAPAAGAFATDGVSGNDPASSVKTEQSAAAAKPAAKKTSVKVSGSPKVGKTMKAKASGAPSGVTAKYTWLAKGKPVGTGTSYKVKSKDHGKHIVVRVTWSDSSLAKSAKSAKSKKVTKQKASVKVGKLKVKGSAKVGKTLKAKAVVKKKTAGVKVKASYTWYVGGKKVKTGSKLKVKSAYAGKTVRVVYQAKWGNKTFKKDSVKKSWKKKVKFSSALDAIAQTARQSTGIPYVFGASSKRGADCSGLVKHVYAQHGIKLPGNDMAIAAKGKRTSNPQPGDVIHYSGHVAIYVGDGKMLEAQMPGTRSLLSPVRGGGTYYRMV